MIDAREMADAILREFGLNPLDNYGILWKLAKAIENYLADYAVVMWSWEDVYAEAREIDIELTEDESREVLRMIKTHHDNDAGITWNVIRENIRDFMDDKS